MVVSKSLSALEMNKRFKSVHVVGDFSQAVDFVKSELNEKCERMFFIGGAKLFETAASHSACRKFYYSKLGLDFECDTYLPKNHLDQFIHLDTSKTYSDNGVPFVF